MNEYPHPETGREIAMIQDLIFGDHPELETIGDIRAEATRRLKEMRE